MTSLDERVEVCEDIRVAQRVFLVQMPKDELARAARAIVGDAAARRAFAEDAAERSAPHLRRVTASEMVIDAAGAAAASSEAWGFARNCMPYLLAATRAEETTSALRTLEGLEAHAEIEAFFVEQAKKMHLSIGDFNREAFVAPATPDVATWILEQLDQAAALREKARSGDPDAVSDYAISTWVWLGNIFARRAPCFWQGRNRWLGGAAFPEAFDVHTSMLAIQADKPTLLGRIKRLFGAKEPLDDPELQRLAAASREQTKSQLASTSLQKLRAILASTATLAPELALPGWEASLAKEGGGNQASGGVAHDRLDDLIAALRQGENDDELPYETGREWAELVIAAAECAKAHDAHLVEGDDVIYGAYRWPPIVLDGGDDA